MNNCIAIKSNGEMCMQKTKTEAGDGKRCAVHHHSLVLHGPHTLALREMAFRHNREMKELQRRHQNAVVRSAEIDVLRLVQAKEVRDLQQMFAAVIRASGRDPDALAKRIKMDKRFEATIARQDRRRARMEADEVRNEFVDDGGWGGMGGGGGGGGGFGGPPEPRNLREFVTDNQNVHTTEAVVHTKRIIEVVREIPVPPEYQWSPVDASLTPFEIGMHCRLSQKASLQMMTQYSLDTAIYDTEPGIYGKVLDSVWQFIRGHPDKEDLCKILKTEMEDNIGMCAQGNLSRLCNILSGYVDGVAMRESVSERLGRLLPPLAKIEHIPTRVRTAVDTLVENGVPREDMIPWLEQLHEDHEYLRIAISIRIDGEGRI